MKRRAVLSVAGVSAMAAVVAGCCMEPAQGSSLRCPLRRCRSTGASR